MFTRKPTRKKTTAPASEPQSLPFVQATLYAIPEMPLDATYKDPEGFFSVQYPKTWNLHKSGSEMQFWVDDQGQAMVAASLHIKATSPQALLHDVSALLESKLDNYQAIKQQEAMLGSYPAVRIEHTYDWDGTPRRGFIVGCVRNRVGYLVLTHAPPERYLKLEPTFQAVANSLHIARFDQAPPYDEWLTYESPRLVFHYLPETFVAREIAVIALEHRAVFEYNTQWLEVNHVSPINFYLYPSKESLYRATAREAGFAINEAREVHALWASWDDHQSLGHEMTHVITYWTLGEPSEALLGEGIAVCLDHAEPSPHKRAAALLSGGRLIPLSKMLGDAWFRHTPSIVYPESGSLVCWLVDQYGVERFKQIYRREEFPVALGEIYGLSIERLEKDWRATLFMNKHESGLNLGVR